MLSHIFIGHYRYLCAVCVEKANFSGVMVIRHSKIQLQVLSLYRQLLRAARNKPGAAEYIQHEFHRNATISKTEVMKIEQLVRRGQRQLENLKKSTTMGVGVFQQHVARQAADGGTS